MTGNQVSVQGIIPAYAGNTHIACMTLIRNRDHPRVCGEHDYGVALYDSYQGSSPRMRGTRTNGRLTCHVDGIIPAYAGNTHTCTQHCIFPGDHPRVCGEHCADWLLIAIMAGSSPRMRGTLLSGHHSGRCFGIIPAYAGNTEVSMKCWTVPRDHPRVCGEHFCVPDIAMLTLGSSPRMRGTQQ